MPERKSKERKDRNQGIECPRCGCRHLPVLYTRRRFGRIVRVRRCRHCGRRVVTSEAIEAWRIPGVDDESDQRRLVLEPP